ncbi:MAG: hypothetical protein P8Y10_15875, partial [Gemmatimonadales bacterium]
LFCSRSLCETRLNLAGHPAYALETRAVVVGRSQAESARTKIENAQRRLGARQPRNGSEFARFWGVPSTLHAAIQGLAFSRLAHPDREDWKPALATIEGVMRRLLHPRSPEEGAA